MDRVRASRYAIIGLAILLASGATAAPAAGPVAAGVTVASAGGNLCAPGASAGRAGPREPSAWKNPPIEEAPDTGHPGF